MGPWALVLLRHYLDILTMVSQAGGYFGTPFKGYCGMIQRVGGYLPKYSMWLSMRSSTWAIGRGEMELENLGRVGIIVDVVHGITGQGRPAELPG